MKSTGHTYTCNSLTNFWYETHSITGNGNYVNVHNTKNCLKKFVKPQRVNLFCGGLYPVHRRCPCRCCSQQSRASFSLKSARGRPHSTIRCSIGRKERGGAAHSVNFMALMPNSFQQWIWTINIDSRKGKKVLRGLNHSCAFIENLLLFMIFQL